MRIIKLLSFYLLFSLSFIVFADNSDIRPNLLDVTRLCFGSYYNECVKTYMNLAVFRACKEPDLKYELCAVAINSDELILDEQEMFLSCTEYLSTQLEIRNCLDIKAKYSQKLLEQVEAQMFGAIVKGDENIYEAAIRFSALSKAFILHRDMQCEFSADLFDHFNDSPFAAMGDAHPSQIMLACIAAQNNQYITQLRETISDIY